MANSDQTIHCVDCKIDFQFTVPEQAFYAEKGFTAPKRCKPCRELKKARNNIAPVLASPPPDLEEPPRRADRHHERQRYAYRD